jgi:uncharacterized protein (DUF1800 family)
LAQASPQQFGVRLSYFWHGHFATSDQKLRDPRAMAYQHATFDRLGAARFDELLAAMCRDPALLRWLDNDANRRGAPNENFARELFELFALGRGHYDEREVQTAARCFTGWHVRDGRFHFTAHLHDAGDKELFGRRGPLGGDDVVAAVVEREASATFLARKWLAFFVHPEPSEPEVEALAAVYLAADRHVGRTLRTLLQSRLFFSPRARACKVKSPADFVIGTVRLLGGRAAPRALATTMQALGESWLEPPSVEGWHGERAWLSPAAWLLRSNFVADLLAGRLGDFAPRPGSLCQGLHQPAELAKAASLWLLDGTASRDELEAIAAAAAAAGADHDAAVAAALHAAACTPGYQLL